MANGTSIVPSVSPKRSKQVTVRLPVCKAYTPAPSVGNGPGRWLTVTVNSVSGLPSAVQRI